MVKIDDNFIRNSIPIPRSSKKRGNNLIISFQSLFQYCSRSSIQSIWRWWLTRDSWNYESNRNNTQVVIFSANRVKVTSRVTSDNDFVWHWSMWYYNAVFFANLITSAKKECGYIYGCICCRVSYPFKEK